jgi:hypothetical protein
VQAVPSVTLLLVFLPEDVRFLPDLLFGKQ